ncbi:MAG: hypothetical protein AAF809_00295 [Bacteroidota bacterium]
MRLLLLSLPLLLAACLAPNSAPETSAPMAPASFDAPDEYGPGYGVSADEFGAYWYQGVAEITSYDLDQARYGAQHDGEAVLVYVTEPFSRSKQVKLDRSTGGADEATVLKLNATRSFLTGIYPYSMMTSVFQPVDAAPTLKVTTTSQEWCGHTFTQLNRSGADGQGGYGLEFRSYFESEGDQDLDFANVMLEDEVWTMIRLNPSALPTEPVTMLPGTTYQRFSHIDWQAHTAEPSLSAPDADGMQTYRLAYPDLGRTLAIRFRAAFPHEIEGWTETRRARGQAVTTTATRMAQLRSAYWGQNSPEDEVLREQLGLSSP